MVVIFILVLSFDVFGCVVIWLMWLFVFNLSLVVDSLGLNRLEDLVFSGKIFEVVVFWGRIDFVVWLLCGFEDALV